MSYHYTPSSPWTPDYNSGFTWPVEDATITPFPNTSTDFPRVIIDSRTSGYTEIKFEHTEALTQTLDIKVGDIILTSISVKDPDAEGTDLGQKSITFTSQIDAITGNDLDPDTATVINIKPKPT